MTIFGHAAVYEPDVHDGTRTVDVCANAMAQVGILTGGGDCPGLNAVIRAIVRRAEREADASCVGFRRGWAGVLEGDAFELTVPAPSASSPAAARSSVPRARTRSRGGVDRSDEIRGVLERLEVDALIAIGGEDTLGVAGRLTALGIPVVGVPKTIDNDLGGTEVTFGFHTAVQTPRTRSTACARPPSRTTA